MHQFASNPVVPVGVIGSEPPLSPETVGRAPGSPAFLDGPLSLKPIPALPQPAPAPEPASAPAPEAPPTAGSRRLVVTLLGGDELELGSFDDRDGAMAVATEVVSQLAAAEAAGEWPEIDGRFLRPASIASVDVLLAD